MSHMSWWSVESSHITDGSEAEYSTEELLDNLHVNTIEQAFKRSVYQPKSNWYSLLWHKRIGDDLLEKINSWDENIVRQIKDKLDIILNIDWISKNKENNSFLEVVNNLLSTIEEKSLV